jgi:hypothetical protein
MNNIFYGHAPIYDGLFIMNLESDKNIYNINAKRWNTNDMNSTYLWHCQLGHIRHKCMKKLHQDGILQSLDFKSFDTCNACLIGKMAKTPFNGYVKRESDLLEIMSKWRKTTTFGAVVLGNYHFCATWHINTTFEAESLQGALILGFT